MVTHIRRIAEHDRDDWQRLWKGYQDFYEVNLDTTTDSTWQRILAANLDPDCDGPHCLVFEEDGALLGFTHYLFHGSAWTPQQRCYLNDLFTLPEARGKGVARALIEAVYEAADAHGCDQTYWMTQDFNHTARKLYDKVAKLTPFIKYSR